MIRSKLRRLFLLVTLAIPFGSGCGDLPMDESTTTRSPLTYGNCPDFTDDQICVCTDPNGLGHCRILGLGARFFANLSTIPDLQPVNDKISSIMVGANVRGKICVHPGWDGACGLLQQGRTYGNMAAGRGCTNGYLDLGWGYNCLNDAVSAIRVDPVSLNCLAPPAGHATIAEHGYLTGDCVVLPSGQYMHPSTNPTSGVTGGGFGLRTDTVTSIIPGPGTSISIFEHSNLTGRGATFAGYDPDLRDDGMNDITSSIRVF